MRVTEDMTTEGGEPMLRLADFIGLDDVGIRVTQADADGHVKIVVNSTAWPNESIWLDPDDADQVADLIKVRAAEARARS